MFDLQNYMNTVEEEYGLFNLKICTKLSDTPLIYKISDGTKHFFLKLHHNRNITEQELNKKYEAIASLKNKKINTPQIYRTQSNSFFFYYQNQIVELYEWLDFEHYSNNPESNESTINLMFRMFDAFKSIPVDSNEKKSCRYICNNDFNMELENYLISKHLPEYRNKIETINVYLNNITNECEEILKKAPYQLIHADYNLKNIGYIENSANILMDFERVKPGYIMEDIALCFFEICIKDTESKSIANASVDFFHSLKKYTNIEISEKLLLFIICKRMLRHIYRGVEALDTGNSVYRGFQSIFLDGLIKTFNYLQSKYPYIEEKIDKESENLFTMLITLSKEVLDDEEVECLKKNLCTKENITRLFTLCCKHKIISNLYYHLITHNLLSQIPTYYKMLLINTMSNKKELDFYFKREFKKLNKILLKNEISYVCIKGLSIANRYYKNSNILRDYNDIDFLVCKKDLAKIEELIEQENYKRGFYDFLTGDFIEASREEIIYYKLSSHQVYPYTKKMPSFSFSSSNVFKIDINFSIFFGGKIKDEIETEVFLEDIEYITDGSLKFPILSPEKELIQLCYSFYKDTVIEKKQNGLKFVLSNLRDICYLIENKEINVQKLLKILEGKNIKDNIWKVLEYTYVCFKKEKIGSLLKKLDITVTKEMEEFVMKCVLEY